MHLVLLGLNHKTAPVDLRERFCIPEEEVQRALAGITGLVEGNQAVILSTCNRMEVYACTRTRAEDGALHQWLADYHSVQRSESEPYLYSRAGHKVAEHLFRVAVGLDSMVLGETQIIGQVSDAYAAALEAGSTGAVLNVLFQQAAKVGKRAQSETSIGRGAFSVGSSAVKLAKSIFDELKGRAVLVVGAGETAELTMNHLTSAGVRGAMVVNRTYTRARELAERYQGQAIEFSELPSALRRADIVVSSTAANEPVITRPMVLAAMHERRGLPMFIVDIAVPRDVEESVGQVDNVFLYNIDDLQAIVDTDRAGRHAEIEKVESIVAEEVAEFTRWFQTLDAVPIVSALREKLEDIRRTELQKLVRKLPDLSEEQRDAINAATRSMVNRICHQPLIRIKEYAVEADSSAKLDVICEAFGLCIPEDEIEVTARLQDEGMSSAS